MFIAFDDRPSDSPLVERVWTSYSERAGDFLSVASPNCEMVVTRYRGQTFMTIRGPETRATVAQCPPDGEWVGIRFTLGTFLPQFAPATLADRHDVTLPGAATRSFWLGGSAWQFPDYENAETFVAGLARRGLLTRDTLADGWRRSETLPVSIRSAQRRFLHASGITRAACHSISRAREAALLLREGVPIVDVVHRTGYFDQPHLTRALRQLIGLTPSQIACGAQQLSFLYKTSLD